MPKHLFFLSLATYLLLCISGQATLPQESEATAELKRGVVMSGRTARAIQIAVSELEKRNLNADDYFIKVRRSEGYINVLFGSLEDVSPHRQHTGCLGPRRCFGVKLAADDLRVIIMHLSKDPLGNPPK